MHTGGEIPAVALDTPVKDVVYVMSSKGLGMTCVLAPEGALAGIITDGDLRRHMATLPDILTRRAGEVMTSGPTTIEPTVLAVEALNLMERRKITSLPVVAPDGRVLGVLHLHDLWRTEMF
jgi:arabinose-5-phosphate isomerase